uniref:Uncharacterized protein n=1 Tax=Arundo donax TaxID=35708 RepID=A0A0A9E042_ARUDO
MHFVKRTASVRLSGCLLGWKQGCSLIYTHTMC